MATASVVVRIDQAAVDRLLTSPQGPAVRDLMRRARLVQNRAKVLCPVDRGDLRGSIVVELATVMGRPTALIGSRLPYAIFVHEGTGIYGARGVPITPRNAKVLAWGTRGMTSRRTRAQVANGMAFARSVKGSPGRPFLVNALPAARG